VVACVIVAAGALLLLDATGEKGSGLGKEFVYDIKDAAKIDANLFLYKESGKAISTGLGNSHAIAVDGEGNIYVTGDKTVGVLRESGEVVRKIKVGDEARCLAVTEDGEVYVGAKDHVEIYDTEGKHLATWESLGEDAILTSIAVSKGNVFVADAGNRIVVRYDKAGNIINYIGRKEAERNIPGFVIPSPYFDIAIGHDGLLRVVNPGRHRIEAYTFGGELEFWWGKASPDIKGFCGCCNPINFLILADGSFVTCEKGLIRVKVYDSEGMFAGVVAGPEQSAFEEGGGQICYLPSICQAGGFDIAADGNGRIFVLDTIKNVVRIFSKF
jgi:hypothetical protein